MYYSYFGFKESPFNLTPDPRYLFLSHYHREALDHLLYGVNERKGFITITGGIGTGKTTLCRAFLSRLNKSTRSALIFNSFISDKELLIAINQEFGIEMDPASKSKKDYIDALNDFLLSNFSDGGNAVLLIDEAQNLSNKVLEQIRMLSNLETEKEKLIQIVLVGQPELSKILATDSLKQLDERITVRYHLKSLDQKDIQAYVTHRLVVAGSSGDLFFTRNACEKIYAYSKGNPRRINAVCDRSLLIAYTKESNKITKEMVGKAIRDIRGNLKSDLLLSDSSRKKTNTVTLLVLLLIASVIAGWNFWDVIFHPPSAIEKTAVEKTVNSLSVNHVYGNKTAELFVNSTKSVSALYDLYNKINGVGSYDSSKIHLGLVGFDIGPEYYVMFKKPFRVNVSGLTSASSQEQSYLVIKKATHDGAIIIDADGNERQVMRSFILDHWGGSVSWIYPFQDISIPLVEGANGPDVMNIQKVLSEIGYPVNATGIYGKSTSEEVTRFQKDYGLLADGVVGPRTRALLYQFED